jgi:hypothetical protein
MTDHIPKNRWVKVVQADTLMDLLEAYARVIVRTEQEQQ